MDSKSDSAIEKSRQTSFPGTLNDAPRKFSDSSLQTGFYDITIDYPRSSIESNEAGFHQRLDSDARDYSSGIAIATTEAIVHGSPRSSSYGEALASHSHNHTALLLKIYDKVEKMCSEMSDLKLHAGERLDEIEFKVSSLQSDMQRSHQQANNRFDQLETKLSDVQRITTNNNAAIVSVNNRIVQKVNKFGDIKLEHTPPSIPSTSDYTSEESTRFPVAGRQLQTTTFTSHSGSHNNHASSPSEFDNKSSGTEELLQSPITENEKYCTQYPLTAVSSSEDSTVTRPCSFSTKVQLLHVSQNSKAVKKGVVFRISQIK